MGINAKNKDDCTALHIAARHGFPDVCAAIVARVDFTEINAKNQDGWTALHFAARYGLPDVCEAIWVRADFT